MHPLAHMLTGAAIGHVASSPALALLGGFLSHFVLDVIPHTEGKTFRQGSVPDPIPVWKPMKRQTVHVWRPSLKKQPPSGLRTDIRMHVLRADIIEAGVEFVAGALAIGWLIGNCPGIGVLSVGLGALGALLPDLIDLPLEMLFGVALLHAPGLHWTVRRRNAVWGVLTQVAVAGIAAAYLWLAGGCG